MIEVRQDHGLPVRQLLAGVLAAALVVLSVLYISKFGGVGQGRERDSVAWQGKKEIDAAIDGLLEHHGILPHWVRTWRVNVPGTPFFRIERRVWVPRDFVVLRFNHDLDQRLSEYGVRVVGLERTAQGTVTLHVLQDGLVVESLSFVPKPDLDGGP